MRMGGFIVLNDDLRCKVSKGSMDGSALSWYDSVEARSPCRSWQMLMSSFQPSYEGSVYEQFLAMCVSLRR